MEKVKKVLFVSLLLLFCSGQLLYACTSFAGYSKKTLYGMNFDYPDTKLNLVIKDIQLGSLFAMEFEHDNKMFAVAQMNSKGLFVATQLQYSGMIRTRNKVENEISIGDLSKLLLKFERVSQIKKYLKDKILFTWLPPNHLLFADKYGDAMIVETNETENKIVPIKNKFIVMTNFCHSDFIGKSPQEVYGIGSERYQTAYEYLHANIKNINLESGLETLRKTAQDAGEYPTQCSMVFDPQNLDVYIVLKGNFAKVWKMSMKNKTIESYQGFAKTVRIQVGQEGISASKLINFQ